MMAQNQIDLLMEKAVQDEYILKKICDDEEASTEIFGFHAQQAAEKLLKVIILKSGAAYPQTHRLSELLSLISKKCIIYPEKFNEVRNLTPFAVEFRYDAMPRENEESIDRVEILNLIMELRQWVENFLNT